MKKTAIIAAMLLLGAARAGAQVDSCLCIWGAADSNAWWNPDTVMVDTCKSHMGFPPSSNEYVYSKHYVLVFHYAVIKLDSVSSDSVLTVPWTYIDTSYTQFRIICKELAATYNGLWFTKLHPSVGDSLEIGYNDFELSIGVYALVDSIEDTLGPNLLGANFMQTLFFNSPTIRDFGVQPTPAAQPYQLIFSDPSHVFLRGLKVRTSYTFFDQLGRVISSNELDPGNYIDFSPLTSGFYILRLEGDVNKSFKIFR